MRRASQAGRAEGLGLRSRVVGGGVLDWACRGSAAGGKIRHCSVRPADRWPACRMLAQTCWMREQCTALRRDCAGGSQAAAQAVAWQGAGSVTLVRWHSHS